MPNGVVCVYPASGGRDASPHPSRQLYPHSSLLWRFGHARGLLRKLLVAVLQHLDVPGIDRLPAPHARASGRLFAGVRTGRRHALGPHDRTLPGGTMLVLNGATNGTARFANQTLYVPSLAQMPFFQSLASGPVGTPAIYNPDAHMGSHWSSAGMGSTSIARMYHSVALLLPDASVLIAGSNPNIDVELTAPYPTTYTAEIFYPPYFSSSVRPQVMGVPPTFSYGGPTST